jgi:hypothetical protein
MEDRGVFSRETGFWSSSKQRKVGLLLGKADVQGEFPWKSIGAYGGYISLSKPLSVSSEICGLVKAPKRLPTEVWTSSTCIENGVPLSSAVDVESQYRSRLTGGHGLNEHMLVRV